MMERGYVTVGLTVSPETRDYCLVVDMRNLSAEAREHLCGRLQASGDGGWWTEEHDGAQRLCADPDTWPDLARRVVAAQRATGAAIRCLDAVRADAHAMATHLAGQLGLQSPTAECLERQGAVDELLASWAVVPDKPDRELRRDGGEEPGRNSSGGAEPTPF